LASSIPRVNSIVDSFASVVAPHSRILDIGAGKGLLAKEMSDRLSACVTMVDVAAYNQTDLPLTLCDSRALAFSSDSFDYALLSFVLHHTPRPELILAEALRVSPRVIVVENHVPGLVRGLVTRLVDSYPALRYGTPPCYLAWTRDRWLRFFQLYSKQPACLAEFTLEAGGFFQNFTVLLERK
jgi:ubiquinone/menaquinone biosynthesis C-methylase UbiE